jgi:multiple sugar transport system substrate-binding protein
MSKTPGPRYRRATATGVSIATLFSFGLYGSASATPLGHALGRTSAGSFAGQTLTVLDGAPTGADASQTQAYYNYVAAQFKKQTGATLKWQYYADPSQEVQTIETSTVSGSGPDVISYGTSFVGTLWATGDFSPLSGPDWAVLGGESSIIKADLFDSGISPSKYIGIPNETNPFVMVYNTAYFKDAGISAPPKSWGALVQDAQKIQAKVGHGVYGLGIDPQDSYDPWKSIFFLDAQMGGGKPWEWINPQGTQVEINNSYVENAIKFYFSLEYKYHIVPPQALTWNGAEMASAFEQQKVAMVIIGGYGYTAASKGTPVANNLAYALLPTIPYGDTSMPAAGIPIETETTGNYWAIPNYASSERALALQFEKVTLSPQVQLYQFKELGWIPVNTAGVAAVEGYSKVAVPFINAEAAAIPTSIAPVWSYVETGMLTAIHNIGSNLAASNSKWNDGYATSQLFQANAAAQVHASGFGGSGG